MWIAASNEVRLAIGVARWRLFVEFSVTNLLWLEASSHFAVFHVKRPLRFSSEVVERSLRRVVSRVAIARGSLCRNSSWSIQREEPRCVSRKTSSGAAPVLELVERSLRRVARRVAVAGASLRTLRGVAPARSTSRCFT